MGRLARNELIMVKIVTQHLLVQIQQRKQNNVWNLFKINNKDIRTTPLTSF